MTHPRVLWAAALIVFFGVLCTPCALAEDEFPEPDPPPAKTDDKTDDAEKADVPETPKIEEPAPEKPAGKRAATRPPTANKDLPPPVIRNPATRNSGARNPGPRNSGARNPMSRIIPAASTPTTVPVRTAPIRRPPTSITSRPVTTVPMQPLIRTQPGATAPGPAAPGPSAPRTYYRELEFAPYTAPGSPATPATTPIVRRPVSPAGPPRATREVRVSNIDRIAKQHNLTMRIGGTGMRIDVTFTAINQANQSVYVGVWFARKEGGELIRSAMRDFSDASGNTTAQTRPVRVVGTASVYKTSVMVPYGAFPAPGAGDSYEIEARVQLMRREGANARILARGTTTFRVHGPEADTGEGE